MDENRGRRGRRPAIRPDDDRVELEILLENLQRQLLNIDGEREEPEEVIRLLGSDSEGDVSDGFGGEIDDQERRDHGPVDNGPVDQERRDHGPVDNGPVDQERRDHGPVDNGPVDQERRDHGPIDNGPVDQERRDHGPVDNGPVDQERRDHGPIDNGPVDQERRDHGPVDNGPVDQERRDHGPVDNGPVDQERRDHGPIDNGPVDQERRDHGPVDNGPVDQERRDHGPIDNGPVDQERRDHGPVDNGPVDQAIRDVPPIVDQILAPLRTAPNEMSFKSHKLINVLKRRFFLDQSFSIYGGVAGLYDFGPMGCSLKANIIQVWRKHFILEEGMLEVDCTSLTPESVLKAFGHVDRFADWMVKDVKNGECFRADHLIKNSIEKLMNDKKVSAEVKKDGEDVLARLEGFDDKDMHDVITRFEFKSPITGNDLTEPLNLSTTTTMFPTQIGPTGDFKAFLRPETAQGIFINFKRLLEFNGGLPFAAAQIGLGFRNEISPRQGLIRVREFTMCEIEHFVDPEDKSLHKFAKVANEKLVLFSACNQLDGAPAKTIPIGEAVKNKTVVNETLGYYMARCHQFLIKVGVDGRLLRFRQHLSNEMAHNAQDCWDAEILTSHGWIECVGNTGREFYDLFQQQKATNAMAQKKPSQLDGSVVEIRVNIILLEKKFGKDSKKIQKALHELSSDQVDTMEANLLAKKHHNLCINGAKYDLTPDLASVERFQKKLHVTPSVIESSFRIKRIMFSILEHSFRQREEDGKRTFFVFKPLIAPIKCSVLPISANDTLFPVMEAVKEELSNYELNYKVDSSGTIGRRYARTDEIGIPFGITVDFDSLKTSPYTVTIRHAETMSQIRVKVSELGHLIGDLVAGRKEWKDAQASFPKFETIAGQ